MVCTHHTNTVCAGDILDLSANISHERPGVCQAEFRMECTQTKNSLQRRSKIGGSEPSFAYQSENMLIDLVTLLTFVPLFHLSCPASAELGQNIHMACTW